MEFFKDKLQVPTEREYTDEGFLKVPARISRTGIQSYFAVELGLTDREPNEIIKVYRPEEEVFKAESLNSFANKPVTNNHPPVLVNKDNSKQFAVGMSGHEVVRDGCFVKTTLSILDGNTISQIEQGKVELSNGYVADINWTSGVTPDGETYDAVQRNIRGNHIAVVEKGRAGNACKVADNLTVEKHQMKVTIDGVDFEVTDQAAQAIAKLQKALSDAEEELKEKDEEMKKKEDEMEEKEAESKKTEDSLKAKLDDATSKIPSSEKLDTLVEERKSLVDAALKIKPDLDWKGKEASAIKNEIVADKFPELKIDDCSADYIAARFDILVETVDSNSQQSLDDAFKKQAQNDKKVEDTRPASVVAREKMIENNRNAWKGGSK